MLSECHDLYSPQVNIWSSAGFHLGLTDADAPCSHDVNMAAPERPLWYLQEWFAANGLIQRDLVTGLDWLPAKAHKVWHGLQEPKTSEIRDIAALLNIAPHELLMPPEEAMRIRRLRSVISEVAGPGSEAQTASTAVVGEVASRRAKRRAG